jgi:hypothetical protein
MVPFIYVAVAQSLTVSGLTLVNDPLWCKHIALSPLEC